MILRILAEVEAEIDSARQVLNERAKALDAIAARPLSFGKLVMQIKKFTVTETGFNNLTRR